MARFDENSEENEDEFLDGEDLDQEGQDLEFDDEGGDDDEDYDGIQALLDEGLQPRSPKRKMNPKSLANLRKGGIDDNIKKDRQKKRDDEIQKRLDLMKEDPHLYYKKVLEINLIKEELNLEDLQDELSNENVKNNQQRIRSMIYTTMQGLLLIGDALKAQPKQNKDEVKKSVSALSEAFEEFRKGTFTPEQANSADKLREEIEKLRFETKDDVDKGNTK